MQFFWGQGALAGNSAEEAYRVKCDEENNPPEARDNGRLLAEIWVAPVHPYEFVAVRVGRSDNSFEVSEMAEVSTGGLN